MRVLHGERQGFLHVLGHPHDQHETQLSAIITGPST